MVCFDVVSLFTKIPVNESLTQLSQHFNNEILSFTNMYQNPPISESTASFTNKKTK